LIDKEQSYNLLKNQNGISMSTSIFPAFSFCEKSRIHKKNKTKGKQDKKEEEEKKEYTRHEH